MRLFTCVLLSIGVVIGLSGCITVNSPNPPESVEGPPVVMEEGVMVSGTVWVAPPDDVEFIFVDGRYGYWHPYYHCWYYRPRAWRPGPRDHWRAGSPHDFHRGGPVGQGANHQEAKPNEGHGGTQAVKPAGNSPVKPAVKPAAKPPVKPAAEPAVKPPVKPTVEPAAKPPVKPAVKPAAKPPVKKPEKKADTNSGG